VEVQKEERRKVMRVKKVATRPNCNFCDEPAKFDAPTAGIGSPWAFFCEECAEEQGVVSEDQIGTEFVQRDPVKPKENKAIPAPRVVTLTEVYMNMEQEVKCPRCDEIRHVEVDADYEFDCEGCGQKLKVRAII